ncbi:MAG: peptidoglycan-binding protein [Reyranella sp.]|nr:peptidoglycan-binding protein [Reyranella sp.]
MATASGKTEGRTSPAGRRSAGPLVAYGVVLVLLGLAGFVVWASSSGSLVDLAAGKPAPATPEAVVATFDPRTAPGLKLPPLPAVQESVAPDKTDSLKAEPQPITPEATVKEVSPPQGETEKKAEPVGPACTADITRWPTDRSDQAKAIQVLLRDLGLYRGTTNGTAGPITRAAIREFQLAAGEAETGEVTEALFEALKKKCAAP